MRALPWSGFCKIWSALSVDVKVYIFDEPTGNLDEEFREEFYRLVRELPGFFASG